jgi:hypothetical protein
VRPLFFPVISHCQSAGQERSLPALYKPPSCVIGGDDVLPLQQEKREYQGEDQGRQKTQLEHHVVECSFIDLGRF